MSEEKNKALELTDANFEELVLQADKPVLVDFWASWCGPCRMISPIVDDIAKDYTDTAVVAKMNVEDNSAIPAKYGIRNIPALLYFKDGEVVDRQVGAVPKSALTTKLDNLLGN